MTTTDDLLPIMYDLGQRFQQADDKDSGLTARVVTLESQLGAGGLRLSTIAPASHLNYNPNGTLIWGSTGLDPLLNKYVANVNISFNKLLFPMQVQGQTVINGPQLGQGYEILDHLGELMAQGVVEATPGQPELRHVTLNTSVTFQAGTIFLVQSHDASRAITSGATYDYADGSITCIGSVDGNRTPANSNGGGLPAIGFSNDLPQLKQVLGPLDPADLPANIAGLPARLTAAEAQIAGSIVRLSDIKPVSHDFFTIGATHSNGAYGQGESSTYKANQNISFKIIYLPSATVQSTPGIPPQTRIVVKDMNGNVLGDATMGAIDSISGLTPVEFASAISIASGQSFQTFLYGGYASNGYTGFYPLCNDNPPYNTPCPDGAITRVNGYNWAFNFSSGPTQPKQVIGPLDPADFPVAADDASLPLSGTALVAGVLKHKDAQGNVTVVGGGGGGSSPLVGTSAQRPVGAADGTQFADKTLRKTLTAFDGGHWFDASGQGVSSLPGVSVAYSELHFAEGSGVTTYDEIVGLRNITGGTWVTGGLKLGLDEYVTLGNYNLGGNTHPFTILAVVRRDQLNTAAASVIIGGPPTGMALRFNTAHRLELMYSQSASLGTGSATYTSTSDWVFVALSYDPIGSAKFYNSAGQDGGDAGTANFTPGVYYAGACKNNTNGDLVELLYGSLAHLSLTNGTMTAGQVAAAYVYLRDKLLADRGITVV